MLFQELGLTKTLAALERLGLNTPTDIQREAIPPILAGRDVIGQSPTGTGKTLAYLLPVLEKIDLDQREIQALVLAPSHELAVQIHRVIEELGQCETLKIISAPMIGHVNIERQIETLKKNKPHLLVGSSGRLLELIRKKKINAQKIRTIIVDEADRLLDAANVESVKAVIKTTFKDRQLLFFSATIPQAALQTASELSGKEPLFISVSPQTVPAEIAHWYFVCQEREKIDVLKKLAAHLKIEKALIFLNNPYAIETMLEKLNYHGLETAALFGSAAKGERQKALENFRSGKVRFLLTSDLGARGLDLPGVPYILNLAMPEEADLYLHRAGRTGRAGEGGTVISLVTKEELPLLNKAQKKLGIVFAAKVTARGKVFDAKG